jgi:hypothetical protein
MLVWKIEGTTGANCGCGSWLVHWAKFGGNTTQSICSANGCYKVATVGAHVSANGKAVIVPMCERHDQQQHPVDVFDYAFAVSAELARTCGKQSLVELGLSALAGIPPHRFQAPVRVAGFITGLTTQNEAVRTETPEELAEASGALGGIKRHGKR